MRITPLAPRFRSLAGSKHLQDQLERKRPNRRRLSAAGQWGCKPAPAPRFVEVRNVRGDERRRWRCGWCCRGSIQLQRPGIILRPWVNNLRAAAVAPAMAIGLWDCGRIQRTPKTYRSWCPPLSSLRGRYRRCHCLRRQWQASRGKPFKSKPSTRTHQPAVDTGLKISGSERAALRPPVFCGGPMLIAKREIESAWQRIVAYLAPTPLIRAQHFSRGTRHQRIVQAGVLQPTHSFKVRGASAHSRNSPRSRRSAA